MQVRDDSIAEYLQGAELREVAAHAECVVHARFSVPGAAANPSTDFLPVHEAPSSRPPLQREEVAVFEVPCREVPYATAKRLLDLVFACSLLGLAAPIMLLAALLVKLTSPGPVFFKQIRVGRGGKQFWCYKFRSMCVDAEAKKAALMHLNEASGPVFKIKRDPRLTPVGGILRKLSIDELPQLWNILRGDMSVVGPRPPLPAEVAQYGVRELGRLAVHPGLTCLWQINGRSNIPFERWMELDLIYIDTMSLRNDIKIVCRTVPTVLFGLGAR